MLISSPWLVVFDVYFHPYDNAFGEHVYPHCQENWSTYHYLGDLYFLIVHLLLSFIVPCIIIGALNLIIFCNVKPFVIANNPDQPVRYNINGITRELVLVSVAFVVCWLPLYALFVKIKLFAPNQGSSSSEEGDDDITDILISLAQLLGASNSCVNPFLYVFHSRNFRHTVSSHFRKRLDRRRRSSML